MLQRRHDSRFVAIEMRISITADPSLVRVNPKQRAGACHLPFDRTFFK